MTLLLINGHEYVNAIKMLIIKGSGKKKGFNWHIFLFIKKAGFIK